MMHRLLAVSLLFVLCHAVSSSRVMAGPPSKDLGKSIADDAAEAFKAQRFLEAAELFEKAYALGSDKIVRLRNAGRAWEEAGKLEYARTQFQRYLDKVTTGPDHDEVAERLARVEARLAEDKAAKIGVLPQDSPAPEVAVVPSPVTDAAVESAVPPLAAVVKPSEPQGKWLAWTVIGAGAALMAGGAAWLAMTESANARMNEQSAAGPYSPQKLADDRAVILRNRVGAISVLSAGAVGIAVGAILALHQPAGHVGPLLTPGGGGVAWSARF